MNAPMRNACTSGYERSCADYMLVEIGTIRLRYSDEVCCRCGAGWCSRTRVDDIAIRLLQNLGSRDGIRATCVFTTPVKLNLGFMLKQIVFTYGGRNHPLKSKVRKQDIH